MAGLYCRVHSAWSDIIDPTFARPTAWTGRRQVRTFRFVVVARLNAILASGEQRTAKRFGRISNGAASSHDPWNVIDGPGIVTKSGRSWLD